MHGAETGPIVKEMVPIGSNTIRAIIRSAGHDVAPSQALTANTCTTQLEPSPVGCSISGQSGGLLSQIVTTQVTHPGIQGTPGDAFPRSLGMLRRPGK